MIKNLITENRKWNFDQNKSEIESIYLTIKIFHFLPFHIILFLDLMNEYWFLIVNEQFRVLKLLIYRILTSTHSFSNVKWCLWTQANICGFLQKFL
ncbi:unnamed protein product [Paramecium octaurelia]|uniref:Uncharacterized protein n=1 Tax=Paramecium octaurelia TaxID=43137 RepID=A0A8S1TFB4_PAROT|nr:unnamed protein product [Paramecium octaurelia]